MIHLTDPQLRSLIEEALTRADALGLVGVGIALNNAMIELCGEGRVPDNSYLPYELN
ncbi:MAG: hypothetical protein QM688_06100 [Sphingomonas bacterium]